MTPLRCELLLEPAGSAQRVAFLVRNTGSERVTLAWEEPLLTFDLEADLGAGRAPILGPAINAVLRRASAELDPGEARRIETPLTLGFAPDGTRPPGARDTDWLLVHPPAPVTVRARLRLAAGTLECEAVLEPAP